MANLITIEDLFNGKTIFRIPDYQRGYSWQERQLEDLWQDIQNVMPDMSRIHYTGSLKVNSVTKEHASNKWKGDLNFIEKFKIDNLLHVIDGQQRLTSIVILIWVILNDIEDEIKKIGEFTILELRQKYIHSKTSDDYSVSYYFGYEDDDPSYEHLKQIIFEQNVSETELIETAYTNNLDFAKKFFKDKLNGIKGRHVLTDKEDIFKIVTQNLKFELTDFTGEDFDINVIFETENNRGKPLTNLEKLKNRLIFLNTLFTHNNPEMENELRTDRNRLRQKIAETWQTIYLFLGLNKKNRLKDDDFLKAHWTMYCRYERTGKDPYARDIFDTVFKVEKVLNDEIKYQYIKDYTESLKQAVVEWYIINNPYHAYSFKNSTIENDNKFNKEIRDLISIEKEEAFELDKLNRLGFRRFAPIILTARINGVYDNNNNSASLESRIELIKAIEKYNFLLFPIVQRKSNLGEFEFQRMTHQLYNPNNKVILTGGELDTKMEIYDIISEVYKWFKAYYKEDSIARFFSQIEELYLKVEKQRNKQTKIGYNTWYGLEYVLQEFELSLHKEKNINYKLPKYIEKLFTEDEDGFNKYKYNPANSLGNLFLSNKKLPINMPINMKLSKMENSSKSEKIIISEINVNNPIETIRKRGLELLSFIEKRWQVSITDEQKEKLLFLNEK